MFYFCQICSGSYFNMCPRLFLFLDVMLKTLLASEKIMLVFQRRLCLRMPEALKPSKSEFTSNHFNSGKMPVKEILIY